MMGDSHVASMLQPMMIELSDEEWDPKGGDGMSTRWLGKVPDFMRQTSKKESSLPKDQVPPLKHDWKLASHRFPMVPYWCLTMKHGKDHGCYGRLQYDRPHDTVHSYHKPHWHPSLVPFAPRVMSVREKARVQGFPDNFIFKGDVGAMYKQIGNAVSPQLTKGIARAIFTCHRASLGEQYSKEPVYSESMELFSEYCAKQDSKCFAGFERHTPIPQPKLKLSPMTYEEILIEYNTETRSDHSSRYSKKTPFELLEEVDGYRNWILDSIWGVRRTKGFLEVCVKYPGWPEGCDKWWVDMASSYRQTFQWSKFEVNDPAKVAAVLAGTRQSYCLPGCDVDSENTSPPQLEEAQKKFDLYKSRYAEDKKLGRIYGGKTLTQYGRVVKLNVDEEDVDVVQKSCGKGQWVSKKRAVAAVAEDVSAKLEWDRLMGAIVSVWWDLYGWSEGVITKVNGRECTIAYTDGSDEEVTLPDDTIKIVKYHTEGEPYITKEDLIKAEKEKEAAEKAKKLEAEGGAEDADQMQVDEPAEECVVLSSDADAGVSDDASGQSGEGSSEGSEDDAPRRRNTTRKTEQKSTRNSRASKRQKA
eukprot:TRINITY_DN14322_c0_g1_i4.p1 TRINITY_DN14322_c0_g1~~TRINITY_DN14322_c0_g1_i4.p1  ORF type:complete len:585 (-),score=169.78 TRINITY_DN14322_c0_g1_i4:63-1817(-)